MYHKGELAIQAQADVQEMAHRIQRGIHTVIPEKTKSFIQEQSFAVVSSVGDDGLVWASVLTGKPGFMHVVDDYTLQLDVETLDDPLFNNIGNNPSVGFILIEFATRRRMRFNGAVQVNKDGLSVSAHQVYANCHKYIQARKVSPLQPRESMAQKNTQLTESQKIWIDRADTLFIASYHPNGGADASHRGGEPGFVHVLNNHTLEFPDYSGNNMFNTLGNITSNPRASLLFIDFENGSTLQLSGTAVIFWDTERIQKFAGAERVIEFSIDKAIERHAHIPLQFGTVEYSPFNPHW